METSKNATLPRILAEMVIGVIIGISIVAITTYIIAGL